MCGADEIEDELLSCIIKIESNGNPNAISLKGAIGLMQITPIVFKELKETYGRTCWCCEEFSKLHRNWIGTLRSDKEYSDLFNSTTNKFVGTWYLRRLKDHYLKDKYTIERMLAAYNGGITRLRNVNYDVSRMPKETRDYVRDVMQIYLSVKEHAKQFQYKSKNGSMEKVEPGYGR